ncbi:cell wall-binding repeat-containing protein [Peptostreptococcus stomatis]|uniref:cell wall-binding repeat-containing protein n=1 Tax=Peptostreptococcus stomatis TaxID=341694 RepID=UPI00235267A3|nr:cell wall-binding repeat-containing protein [Peptostreptococcus stomatis]
MKIKKKLAVTLTLMMTLSIISTNNYALENNTGNETKKEQKEEIVITKDKDDKKLEDTSDKTKKNLSVTRISGSDRYDTSYKIQEFLTKDKFSYYASLLVVKVFQMLYQQVY